MENVHIRKVALSGVHQLQQIARQTFSETFSKSNSAENMKQYLAEGFSDEKIISEVSNEESEFYFALLNDEIIGYLKVNYGEAQTELNDNNALEIERIYVLQAFHGKNIGQVLYEKAIEIAKQRKTGYVWLGVWEENPRAIHFYKKYGFVEFSKHIFKLGDDEQTDIMMKLNLKVS